MPPQGTEEYKEKRDRNNVAVRKSREMARAKAKQTMSRVSNLRDENRMLEQQVEILSKELTILKDLFKMVHDDQGQCPVNNTEISIQTEGSTSPTTFLDDPALLDLKEDGAPIILDGSGISQNGDHQYIKIEIKPDN